jgi:hypothetical protein
MHFQGYGLFRQVHIYKHIIPLTFCVPVYTQGSVSLGQGAYILNMKELG